MTAASDAVFATTFLFALSTLRAARVIIISAWRRDCNEQRPQLRLAIEHRPGSRPCTANATRRSHRQRNSLDVVAVR